MSPKIVCIYYCCFSSCHVDVPTNILVSIETTKFHNYWSYNNVTMIGFPVNYDVCKHLKCKLRCSDAKLKALTILKEAKSHVDLMKMFFK